MLVEDHLEGDLERMGTEIEKIFYLFCLQF